MLHLHAVLCTEVGVRGVLVKAHFETDLSNERGNTGQQRAGQYLGENNTKYSVLYIIYSYSNYVSTKRAAGRLQNIYRDIYILG